MKSKLTALLCFICLQSHAEIIQHSAIINEPSLTVRAGEQKNGHLAIEQLFTNNTTSAQESLAGSVVPFTTSADFGGSSQRGAPGAFNSLAEIPLPPATIPLPTNPLPPVLPPVPEPETYALMAIGLSGLLLARRKRAKTPQA